jgi:hypothetical protein
VKYIPRVDETLVAPPYLLGKLPQYRFESNVFFLTADHAKLQKLVDEQLNAAVPKGPVHYHVPALVQRVWVAFVRYEYAEAQNQPDRGWLSYSEAMIGFLVARDGAAGRLPELLTYLGVVYIDDSKYADPVVDPYTLAIVLGREAYGLPKSPGQIRYAPYANYPNYPKLEVWDISKTDKRLQLADAIVVSPVPQPPILPSPAPLGVPPSASPAKAPQAGLRAGLEQPRPLRKLPPFRDEVREPRRFPNHPFLVLALQFGMEAEELKVEPKFELEPHAYAVDVGESTPAIAYDDLWWRSKLVGLKQFPDPKVAGTAANPAGDACYQVIVESPLVESGQFCGPETILNDQLVEFPDLGRVNLVDRFGIQTTTRKVVVGQDEMYYQCGALIYADASKVNVWTPTP